MGKRRTTVFIIDSSNNFAGKELKRVLIISPHFPPVNAPDMQRVRQALPYLGQNGWEAEVIAVDPAYVEVNSSDKELVKTIPPEVTVHWVKAWSVEKTRKFGLGSLSMRSWTNVKKKGNELLGSKKFDLVFFSTTAFHVLSLGPYWKKKHKIPFVVDIQDPWRNDFYLDKPKHERPPKFWLSYNIDKYLEAKTIPKADGILSVSKGYITDFRQRYPGTVSTPSLVLPFGGNKFDFDIAAEITGDERKVSFDPAKKNIVYIGRGGKDLKRALSIFFNALKMLKETDRALYAQLHCWFIGTSYAAPGKGSKTVYPVAQASGVEDIVTEVTDRLPYFESLRLLKKAALLFVPGSTDTAYTASKIYPYILAQKNLLAVFHRESSIVNIFNETGAGKCLVFDEHAEDDTLAKDCLRELRSFLTADRIPKTNWSAFEQYTAESMTKKMTDFFESVI